MVKEPVDFQQLYRDAIFHAQLRLDNHGLSTVKIHPTKEGWWTVKDIYGNTIDVSNALVAFMIDLEGMWRR